MVLNTGLPIEEVLPELREVLRRNTGAVVEAPPGAGKTTVIPLALLDEGWLGKRRIIMLEPRRLAARAAARRMARLIREEPGLTIGYRTRLESRTGPRTRIEVVTEGVLTRLLQADPSLEAAGIVIFDEFHERSLQADLGLALCLEARGLFRPDLKILIMSATIDGDEAASLIGGAPVIRSAGRSFPVEVRYRHEAPSAGQRSAGLTDREFISRVSRAVLAALREETGSILVFLPGASEIRRVEATLREARLPDQTSIVPLYGDLPGDMQDLAIKPPLPGCRKVVLATSIAETSLTIEGVRVVIDSGLMRVSRYSPSTGMSSLETINVTKASAAQRCGRAGRLEPGICLRLWPEAGQNILRDKNTPEILDADLAPLVLELFSWGVKDPYELKWLDPPPKAAVAHATETLVSLGALSSGGEATAHGEEMAKLGLHPRLSHMVLKARELGMGGLGCLIAALISERDFFVAKAGGKDPDIRKRLEALIIKGGGEAAGAEFDRGLFRRINDGADKLMRQLGIKDRPDGIDDIDRAGLLLAFAYPDRIAMRRADGVGRYLLSNGRGAYLGGPELSKEEFLVAANLDGAGRDARILLAAPVEKMGLLESFSDDIREEEVIGWDQAAKGVAAVKRRILFGLTLSEAPLKGAPEDMVLGALLSGLRQNGLDVLPWDRRSQALRERAGFLRLMEKEVGVKMPDVSDTRLIETLDEWLGPFIGGMTRLEHLKSLDLEKILKSLMTREETRALDALAPESVIVPSGSRIIIDYKGERPVLAVRLQEVLGLGRTPCVLNGRMPLLLHLLSPAGRPLQVTDDLAGFWANSYPMVKKEMKGRYPKHYWPDDPMEAEPTRGAKRRREKG